MRCDSLVVFTSVSSPLFVTSSSPPGMHLLSLTPDLLFHSSSCRSTWVQCLMLLFGPSPSVHSTYLCSPVTSKDSSLNWTPFTIHPFHVVKPTSHNFFGLTSLVKSPVRVLVDSHQGLVPSPSMINKSTKGISGFLLWSKTSSLSGLPGLPKERWKPKLFVCVKNLDE